MDFRSTSAGQIKKVVTVKRHRRDHIWWTKSPTTEYLEKLSLDIGTNFEMWWHGAVVVSTVTALAAATLCGFSTFSPSFPLGFLQLFWHPPTVHLLY